MIILLKKDEREYLIDSGFIEKEIIDILANTSGKNEAIIKIDMQDDQVDRLFEKLEDRLQVAGFDGNYELTKEGTMIENLMDKLNPE